MRYGGAKLLQYVTLFSGITNGEILLTEDRTRERCLSTAIGLPRTAAFVS